MPAVIPPTGDLPVAPPTDSLRQQTDAAYQSGDAKNLYSLLPAAQGTTYVPKILAAAQDVQSKTVPIDDILQKTNAAGGVGNPKGNIAAANAIQQTWADKQPETGFLKGLAQGLMGNPNWRNAATQGVITPKPIFDENGKGATAFYAQNSLEPIRVIESGTGRELSPQEYEKRNFNKYSTYENTPGYLQNKEIAQKNATQFSDDLNAANVGSAVANTVANNSKNIINGFAKIAAMPNTQLTKEEIDEIHSLSTRTGTSTQAISKGIQGLNSVTDSNSFGVQKDALNKAAIQMGLPGIIGYNQDGSFKLGDNSSISRSALEQKMKTANSSASQENAFTQNKQALTESKVYKKLPYEGQVILDTILAQSAANQRIKDSYFAKYGSNPLFTDSTPWQPGQPMSVGVANALIDEQNSKVAELYRQKMDEARQSGIPDRGSVFQATLRDPNLDATRSIYTRKINDVIQSDAQRNQEQNGAAISNVNPAATNLTLRSVPSIEENVGTQQKKNTQPSQQSSKKSTPQDDILHKLFPLKGK